MEDNRLRKIDSLISMPKNEEVRGRKIHRLGGERLVHVEMCVNFSASAGDTNTTSLKTPCCQEWEISLLAGRQSARTRRAHNAGTVDWRSVRFHVALQKALQITLLCWRDLWRRTG